MITQCPEMPNEPHENCVAFARRRRGFTLAEVMMAIGVLGIGLIGIAAVFPVAIVQQKRAVDDSLATVMGNNVLSILQALGPNGTYQSGAAWYPPTSTFVDSGAPPVGLDATDSYLVYSGPTDTYRFRLAHRRPDPNGPVEVAVFVYRRDADTTTDTEQGDRRDTVRIGVRDDVDIKTNGDMSGGDSQDRVFVRNQLVLAEAAPGNVVGRAYVLKITKKKKIAMPPSENTRRMLFLYDDGEGPQDRQWDGDGDLEEIVRAKAIVIGIVK